MKTVFQARGLNPATGCMVDLLLLADSAPIAKRQLEDCGVRFVLVHEVGTAKGETTRADPTGVSECALSNEPREQPDQPERKGSAKEEQP